MGEPPLLAGAGELTVNWPLPGATLWMLGAPGTGGPVGFPPPGPDRGPIWVPALPTMGRWPLTLAAQGAGGVKPMAKLHAAPALSAAGEGQSVDCRTNPAPLTLMPMPVIALLTAWLVNLPRTTPESPSVTVWKS